jgi:hypothetical protein
MSNDEGMISNADMMHILQLSEDIKAAMVGISNISKANPAKMVTAMAIAIADINLSHAKPGYEEWSLEQMIDGIRAMHADLMEAKHNQDMADAAEARQRGSIQ